MTKRIILMLSAMVLGLSACVAIAGEVSLIDGQIQFMGQAEEEITNKTYDKNLWAKALLEAEGDEQKRKAKYIMLRSRQLYLEANPSAIITVPEVKTAEPVEKSKYKLSRTYDSSVKGHSFYFTAGQKNHVLSIRQKGNEISGKFRFGFGEFTGVIEGNEIKVKWVTINGEGTGKWKILREGKELKGTWRARTGDSGSWVLISRR